MFDGKIIKGWESDPTVSREMKVRRNTG